MLQPRIIPVLLIHKKALYKTIKFKSPKYIGDPINAVRIFNEKEVDELVVIDIDATVNGNQPDYNLISNLASECQMPICYAGGVKTKEQISNIVSLGIEKVAISSAAVENIELIQESSAEVGSQSIVVILDVKKKKFTNNYEIFTHNGKKGTGLEPVKFASILKNYGVGEIIINSIDKDGTLEGYELDLISRIYDAVNLPISCLGGAGSLDDIKKLFQRFKIIGACAGSLFVLKGKYRAVLIQYPSNLEKKKLLTYL